MKKVKGTFATLLIVGLLVGSIGLVQGYALQNKENIMISGEFTTLEDPKPIIF